MPADNAVDQRRRDIIAGKVCPQNVSNFLAEKRMRWSNLRMQRASRSFCEESACIFQTLIEFAMNAESRDAADRQFIFRGGHCRDFTGIALFGES